MASREVANLMKTLNQLISYGTKLENMKIQNKWDRLILVDKISIISLYHLFQYQVDVLSSVLLYLERYRDPLLALRVAQLLYEAGLDMTTPKSAATLRLLASKVENLQPQPQPPGMNFESEEHKSITWVRGVTTQPRRLWRSAVAAIRESLEFDIPHVVHQISLPQKPVDAESTQQASSPAAALSRSPIPQSLINLILVSNVFPASSTPMESA